MDHAIALLALLATFISVFGKAHEKAAPTLFLGVNVYGLLAIVLAILAFGLQVSKSISEAKLKDGRELDAMYSVQATAQRIGQIGASLEFLGDPNLARKMTPQAQDIQFIGLESKLDIAIAALNARRTYWLSILPPEALLAEEEMWSHVERLNQERGRIGWNLSHASGYYQKFQESAAKLNAALCSRSKALGKPLPGITGFQECDRNGVDWTLAKDYFK